MHRADHYGEGSRHAPLALCRMLFNGAGRPLNLDAPSATLPASMGGNKTPIIDQRALDGVDDGLKQVCVRAGSHRHQHQCFLVNAVDQQPVWRQMELSIPAILPD